MDKKEKPRDRQREFLFVFSNGCTASAPPVTADDQDELNCEPGLDEERVRLLKRRLISELRDLGC